MPHVESEVKLDFKDVLIRPKRSTIRSRADVDLHRAFTFMHTKGISYDGVPVIASNMDTVGTFEMATALSKHDVFTCIHKHYSVEEWLEFGKNNDLTHVAISAGMNENDIKKVRAIIPMLSDLNYICLDVANGYSEHFVKFIQDIRAEFPAHVIIAGNVVTGDMTEQLLLAGCDIVKVGIGPGSVCTTRKKTGVGYPQLSAVLECAEAAHGLGGHVISDGGCTCPGDVAKAFGAGADFVMAGGMLAGHIESGGERFTTESGKELVKFYGMSSSTAMKKHSGGVAEYRASEGKTVEVPFRGPVDATILDILGGLRSTCTYVGAKQLKELSRRTTFIRCTQQTNEIFTPFNKSD